MEWYYGFLIFVVGLFIGSFLNVCIYRIPNNKSIVTPGSTCPNCNTRLKPLDLVPVFSYLLLNRKCRYCGKDIAPRYMMVELLTGLLFAVCFIVFGISGKTIAAIALTSVLIAVTFIDIDHGIIPNSLLIFGLICGIAFILLGYIPYDGVSLKENLLGALFGMLCGSLPLVIINILSMLILKRPGIGGGDVKLMAMAGIYLGIKNTIGALILGVLFGGIYGIYYIAKKKKLMNDKADENNDDNFTEIPFGPFLSAGIYLCMLFGTQLIDWYISLYF